MSAKRLVLPLVLVFFPVLSLAAATVSFMVIETGLSPDSGANQHSYLWESGLLDVFFESGHIVSNAPTLRLDYMPEEIFPEEAARDRDEAIEGGIDFFVIAVLDYQNRGDENSAPKNIFLRLFRARPWEMIYETRYADTKSRNTTEEFNNLKQAARGLTSRLK